MTQNRGFIPPMRRPGVLGIHSIDHFAIQVPDLEVARSFYDDFGLDVREEGNELGLYVQGQAHRCARVTAGAAKRLSYISFGAYADDMPRFEQRLQELGVKRTDPPAGLESNGIWFRDPWGVLLEIKVAEKSTPTEKAQVTSTVVGPNQRGAYIRAETPRIRPRRFSHMLIFTPDPMAAIRFYSQAVGLRLSDEAGGAVAFMHGVHGSDHHLLALAPSSAPGLHHSSWDVSGTNEVGLGAMQMADKGHSRGWGLGRHVLGSNYFHYVRDPWGSYAEYSAEIDYVPVDQDWPEGHWDAENGFYLWGPVPPEDFVVNYEVG